jgi:hypothetical protein
MPDEHLTRFDRSREIGIGCLNELLLLGCTIEVDDLVAEELRNIAQWTFGCWKRNNRY